MTAGSVVVVRDEEWLVRSARETEFSGQRLEVTGQSELVRDQDAVFFTGLEEPGSVLPLDPRDAQLVADDTPGFRRSRLWLESLLRRSPLPSSDSRIAVGHRALLDLMGFQLRPAQQVMRNLRPRILIGDAVGLGKTLEIGIVLSELARRGRAERILVVTPRAVLEQFQREIWTRFAVPLVRLDSDGIQRVRQTLPASRNPFSYFRRVICSIDTLKNPARYRHHLEQQDWDVVVIDECHNLINRGTQNNQLARLLARHTEALVLASATPHNGKPESFAELVRLLDPTAIVDPSAYTAKDIEHLYVRRHRNSPDVAAEVGNRWKRRGEPDIVPVRPSAAEEAVLRELKEVWLHPAEGKAPSAGKSTRLFPWTLFKAFLSSPQALRRTIERRLKSPAVITLGEIAARERSALNRLDDLAREVEAERPSKFEKLVATLTDIGVGPGGEARAVVFSERVDTLRWLQRELPPRLNLPADAVALLHAQLPEDVIRQRVESFGQLATTPIRVLLASDMASEGLSLHHHCHQLVHYDLPWSFIRIQQRNGRIDRYGQLHEPRVTALALTSSDPEVDSDLRVVTKLLQKEHAANQALGDAGALLNLYDEEIEEDTVLRRLSQGEDPDTFVPDPELVARNPFAALMTTGGEHRGEPPPETVTWPTLFDDDDNFLAEAIQEIIGGDGTTAQAYELHRDATDDLIAFNTPDDRKARLHELPAEYLRDRHVDKRIKLTASRRVAEEQLAEARRTDETSWPDAHFLAPLHPVLDWATDRVLARFGRNKVPLLEAAVAEPYFLTQAVWSNALGQAVVEHWGAVSGLPGDPAVIELVALLEQAGIKEHSVNPGHASAWIERLQPLVPAAIDAAREDLHRRGAAMEDELLGRLEEQSRRLRRWRQDALFAVEQQSPNMTTRRRRESIESDAGELDRLINSLALDGEPFVRVVGAVVPRAGGG